MMKLSYLFNRVLPYVLFGFILGIIFSLNFQRPCRKSVPISFEKNQSKTTSSEFEITTENLPQVYEAFYKFYELNREWMKKSFLGVHFLQNPNDAITIAEILFEQDIDLVIETGSYRGAAALFFASIMYQYRYNASTKTVRPFKIITMDISPEAKIYIERFPLLAGYILFIPQASVAPTSKALVNSTYNELQPKNVFISLDGDHYARPVYDELLFYHNYVPNIGNYILVQDTRLSSKWHTMYCGASTFDGPCSGPQEAVNWFLKNEGRSRFDIDRTREYLFSTHRTGWLKKIAH